MQGVKLAYNDRRCYYHNMIASMLVDAHNFGLSRRYDISDFLPERSKDLDKAWDIFLSENPGFNDDFSDELSDPSSTATLEELVDKELKKQKKGVLFGATILKVYEREYTPESEGTGWHKDIKTGADLVIVHTLYGEASFEAVRKNGANYSAEHSAGDVIAFAAGTLHNASPPVQGNRKIEGLAIKLRS